MHIELNRILLISGQSVLIDMKTAGSSWRMFQGRPYTFIFQARPGSLRQNRYGSTAVRVVLFSSK
jgi:hypothetical protein